MNHNIVFEEIRRIEDAVNSLKRELNLSSVLITYSQRPQTFLVATMPDGTVIDHKNVRDTFIEVIKQFGINKVKKATTGLVFDEEPREAFRKVGKYYVVVGGKYGSTAAKKKCLLNLASYFGINLNIETVEKVAL